MDIDDIRKIVEEADIYCLYDMNDEKYYTRELTKILRWWRKVSSAEQMEKIVELIKIIATLTDPQGNVKVDHDNIFYIWSATLPKVRKEKILEVLEALKTYADKVGRVQPRDLMTFKTLMSDTSLDSETEKEIIMKAMKKLKTYIDEDGKVQQGGKNIKSLYGTLTSEQQMETLMEAIKILATYKDNEFKIQQGGANIFYVCQATKEYVKKAKFMEVLEYFVGSTYRDELNKEQKQMENLMAFLYTTPKEIIEEYYEEICKMALEFEDKGNDISRILIKCLPRFQDVSEHTKSKIINDELVCKINFSNIKQMKDVLANGVPVCLEASDASVVSLELINQLEDEGINLQYVDIGFNDHAEEGTYQIMNLFDIVKYKKIRKKIDEILIDVDKNDTEVKKFLKIIKKICRFVSYDYFTCLENWYEGFFYSSNIEGALLRGMCICAGYAELLRNMSACCGIEAIVVWDNSHYWNQVKLDGIWYNVDITQDSDLIKMLTTGKIEKSTVIFKPKKEELECTYVASEEMLRSMAECGVIENSLVVYGNNNQELNVKINSNDIDIYEENDGTLSQVTLPKWLLKSDSEFGVEKNYHKLSPECPVHRCLQSMPIEKLFMYFFQLDSEDFGKNPIDEQVKNNEFYLNIGTGDVSMATKQLGVNIKGTKEYGREA